MLTLVGCAVVLAAVVVDMLAPHPQATSTTSMESMRSGSPA